MRKVRNVLVLGLKSIIPLMSGSFVLGITLGVLFHNMEIGIAVSTTLAGSIGFLIG